MKFQENNVIGCMYKEWFKNKVKHKQRAHYISVDLGINRYSPFDQPKTGLKN
jgi:DNA-directed RNA polymerase subunit N (RpoN/RPB10)